MAQNISYANDDAILESLILHILPDFGPHGDGIINSNGLTAALNAKGARQIVDGGLEFWAGILKAENSNFKWQGKNDDMNAQSQDPNDRLRFPVKVFTGSVVVNGLDKAMNKGRAMVKNFAMTLREQANTTIKNQFNSAWWDTSPSGDVPESVPNLISITPTSGVIGGLNRAGNTHLQNGVDTSGITDIGSEAGIAALEKLRIEYIGNAATTADIIVMDSSNFAGLVGYLASLKRYTANEALAQLRIPNIQLGSATILMENLVVKGGANTITAGYVYGINSDHLKIKTLRDGNAKWSTEFERIGKSLNKAVFFNWFGNLVVNNPRAHWVATGVATT